MRDADGKGGPLRLTLRTAGRERTRAATASRDISLVLAVSMIVACLVILVVLGPASLLVRASVFVVALGAAGLLARFLRSRAHAPNDRPGPNLIVDDLGLSIARSTNRLQRLLPLRPTFGVTILASAARDKVVLAITAPGNILCVGADVSPSGPDRRRILDLLPHSVTASGDDLVMSTVLPDGTVVVLSDSSWLRLLDALVGMDTLSLDRCFLSDSAGGQIVWTGDRLRARGMAFQLDQPFEWRGWVFHEAARGLGAAFQATSIRQGKDEVVFVSLVGADVRVSIHDAEQSRLADADSFLLRDARLSDMPLGPPPAHDRRLAIDRLFMLPLRRALDRAQRVNRSSVPGDASAP